MNKSPSLQESKFILYKDENGEVSLRVLYGDETVWLSQKGLAELFDVEVIFPRKNGHIIFSNLAIRDKLT